MLLIPYKRLSFKVSLSTADASKLLADSVDPNFSYFSLFRKTDKTFQGKVNEAGFQISRIIRYRNSFLPTLNGKFVLAGSGTQVDVTLSMHPLVIGFLIIWFGAFIFFSGAAFLGELMQGGFNWGALAPMLFVLLFYGIVTALFAFEANKAEQFLNSLYDLYKTPW